MNVKSKICKEITPESCDVSTQLMDSIEADEEISKSGTGKSFSEALILASVNPQYGKRLFIEFPQKYKFTTGCVQKLYFSFCFDIQNNICTQHVVNLYFFREFNGQSLVILWVN